MRQAAALALVALLSGCASTQYFHTSLTDPGQIAQRRAIDDAYCAQVAMGSAPVPQIVTQPASPSSYQASGTISGYSPNTGYSTYNYSGTVRPSNSAANSFNQGFANGMNMGNAMAARRAQDTILHGCMVSRGWTDDPARAATVAATTSPSPQKRSTEDEARKKWFDTIDEFYATEALKPGGIDYRKDSTKRLQLDTAVKSLANDPKNEDKTMLWFLTEADKIVKGMHGSQRQAGAFDDLIPGEKP
jgi:hypothetical protein